MTTIVTHRGLDPSRDGYFLESSYQAFEDQLLRGFGLEVDTLTTKDGRVLISHDGDPSHITGVHIASLEEILSLFTLASKKPGTFKRWLAIHVKAREQEEEKLARLCNILAQFDTSSILLFDLAPAAATYIKEHSPKLQLAASVAHPYDVERYGGVVGNTLLTIDEALTHKALYSWAWLDEWDRQAPHDAMKKFYTKETFSTLRASGFKIALVMPELHSTSPGLLGGEAHEDALTPLVLQARWKEILSLGPDLVCTDYPDTVGALLPASTLKVHTSLLRSTALAIAKRVVEGVENYLDQFVTFHLRPRRAGSMHTWQADEFPALSKWALVLQGPISLTHDFTLETIRLYKTMFRNPIIVLSTWKGENMDYIERYIVPEGIDIVYSEKPAYGGPTNINFQIVSARVGVERAQALGAEYAMKTRTDQRIYEKNVLEFITNTLEHFPASERSKQKKRLAFVHGLPKYAPYQFADLCMGGHINDVLEYWQVPLVKEGETSAFFVSEVYLATEYLKKKGWKLTWTTEHLWDIYRECIVPIDWYMLDLYWPKYLRHREYKERYSYTISSDLLRYSEWFNLFSNPRKTPPKEAKTFFFRGRIPLKKDQR